jgi:four helix bundle protein
LPAKPAISIFEGVILTKLEDLQYYFGGDNMAFLFENLDVYQKSLQLADELTDLSETFPGGKYYLRDQLDRALLSITNNIAEGNGRFTKNDKVHFFIMARGSAFECVPVLDMCCRKKLITSERFMACKERLDNICRMISGLIKSQDR